MTMTPAVVGMLVLGSVALAGCSSPPPPPQSPSQQGIRADSDRFFNKMKEEEKAKEPQQGSGY